jgi:undecaprenyl-diphosphatase
MASPAQTATLQAHAWRIDPRKALGVAAVCWIGFALIAWLVHTNRAAAIDRAGLLFWRGHDLRPLGPPWMLEAVRDFTALGGVLLRNLFAIGAIAALLFVRLRREAMLLALTIACGWLVDDVIKLAVGRPRPEIAPHLTEAGGASFPSGHSFNSAVVYIAIALAFAAIARRESVRLTIIACALVTSLAIAWSRVWLGVHWPTDAVAGWLGGVGWAFLANALLNRPARAAADQIPESGP